MGVVEEEFPAVGGAFVDGSRLAVQRPAADQAAGSDKAYPGAVVVDRAARGERRRAELVKTPPGPPLSPRRADARRWLVALTKGLMFSAHSPGDSATRVWPARRMAIAGQGALGFFAGGTVGFRGAGPGFRRPRFVAGATTVLLIGNTRLLVNSFPCRTSALCSTSPQEALDDWIDELSSVRGSGERAFRELLGRAMVAIKNLRGSDHIRDLSEFLGFRYSRYQDDFAEILPLGRGACGRVWRVENRLDTMEYAIKKIRFGERGANVWKVCVELLEARILREVKFPARPCSLARTHTRIRDDGRLYRGGRRRASSR
ncbi:hypothetical protein BDK51DRAFT_37479 [Blyttiomyces helicus]|uniref:Protein kinase domain-containing protein n=1 Tax=Blyttiomyces helicus TaxID=388810 RepID=A0A4P9VWU5_9FUNG|nr:hypothetical protein BDK51DRAFT_37479 [Blyttiomyces helicus]|eukprot:RKO83335.1 hypothetical protein BDK51DRAFT_37479 [Blyttiomyces helicus]